jgi:putative tricarboxylic transport membrane protein
MNELIALLGGTAYGLIIGIIPGAGATTGLIAIYGFIYMFPDPYVAVIFCMAVVAASTTADTYTSILLGIPGANSSAATMVDGFPLAQQGKATYAISAAITTSTVNGLLWGIPVFLFFPYYAEVMLFFGTPELWMFTILAMSTVVFISNHHFFKGIIALAIGIFIGLIGIDPNTAIDRFTFGWDYLADGVQLITLVAGVFAVPEMIDALRYKQSRAKYTTDGYQQTIDGIKEVWYNRWLALRGGAIGALVGALPGLGGAISDWMSYGLTVAANPNEKFGNGNIKGVIGPEGSNNAHKATSMIPTVLFGIPGAPFAVILLGLFGMLDFELGTMELLSDTKFFESMTFGFLWATVLIGIISFFITKYVTLLVNIPYKYYFPILLAILLAASVQYTGGWEDYVMFIVATIIGVICKHYNFNRAALLIGFILAMRIEALTLSTFTIYNVGDLFTRPTFIILVISTITVLIYGLKTSRKNKVEFV